MSFLSKSTSGIAGSILGGIFTGIKWLINAFLHAFKRFYEILNRGND